MWIFPYEKTVRIMDTMFTNGWSETYLKEHFSWVLGHVVSIMQKCSHLRNKLVKYSKEIVKKAREIALQITAIWTVLTSFCLQWLFSGSRSEKMAHWKKIHFKYGGYHWDKNIFCKAEEIMLHWRYKKN